MLELIAPKRVDITMLDDLPLTVFLAGTIDNGNSINWQKQFPLEYNDEHVIFFNPRRLDWDPTWEPVITNVKFKEQVDWEMDYLLFADVIVFNFEPQSMSPITLAELGLHVGDQDKHILVRCPQGFYRKGNVDIICQRHNVPVYENMDDIHAVIKYMIHQKSKFNNAQKRCQQAISTGQYTTGL